MCHPDNCDLNLRVRDDGLKAHPLTVEGFGFMWSGARAMFGVKSGKVAYEVKVSEQSLFCAVSRYFSCVLDTLHLA